ncbi:hypothetical protein ACRRTK_024541 [Alexandromys fortis]
MAVPVPVSCSGPYCLRLLSLLAFLELLVDLGLGRVHHLALKCSKKFVDLDTAVL